MPNLETTVLIHLAIIVAVLATMLQAAIINPPKAFASTYDCESNPRVTSGSCYGMVSWFGGTFGVTEHIYVNPLTCTNCHASNGYKLNEEVWLVDENSGGYVEVGYGARPLQNGAQWYFWANTPPNQGQARFDLAPVPAADYYNHAFRSFLGWLTRFCGQVRVDRLREIQQR